MFKRDDGSLTRRELLTTLAGTAVAAPLAAAVPALAQAPKPASDPKIKGATEVSGGKAVLKPTDLKFVGYIRLATDVGDLWFSSGTLALRRVAGQSRVFMQGNQTQGCPILEFTLPDALPKTDLASAPVAPLSRNWGELLIGRTLTGGGWVPGGLFWDEPRQGLWWSYGDDYVPTQSSPTLGCSVLNSSGGTSYGPWRTEWTAQTTRGALCQIPDYFSSVYTAGKGVAISAAQHSGNATSPFGAAMSAMLLPDPIKTPADTLANGHWTVANHGLILHDILHRQARDTNYRTCGWRKLYDCKGGSDVLAGPPVFGGADPAVGENDTMSAMVWVDLPDKHGVLYFGQLVTTPTGYSAPGDPDGVVHMWYGDPYRKDGSTPQTCCHGQDDPWWGATGPGAHYRVPMGWIYNPHDLVATAQKKADVWSRTPTSTFQWADYVPSLKGRMPSGMWGGAVFDAQTRRVYVVVRTDNVSAPPHARPTIMVFEVA